MVVDLHGLTATGERHDGLSDMRDKAEQEGFIVAQPDGGLLGNAWDVLTGSPDIEFVRALVADVESVAPLDPARVHASGFSNGGGLANRLACEAPDLIASVASVAGTYIGAAVCEPGRPVAVLAIHGDDDPIVPYEGGLGLFPSVELWAEAWAERNGCEPSEEPREIAADVALRGWGDCDDRTAVQLYTIAGGGHDWPGPGATNGILSTTDSISATDIVWQFFVDHPHPAA